MYYLQSRYYDPAIGRFINADTFATTDDDGFLSCNMFAYCENDPINRVDRDGEISHVIIGVLVGAAVGVAGQVVSDIATSLATGSPLQLDKSDYLAATVGGTVSGGVLAATGNVNLANAVSGAVTTGASDLLKKAAGNSDKTWGNIIVSSFLDGVVSCGVGKHPGIKGITKGRNSYTAVYKSGLTKIKNGTLNKMGSKVLRKGLASGFVGGLAMDMYYGFKKAFIK